MYFVLGISIILVLVVYMLFMTLFYKSMFDMENSSSYECGFNPNSLTRVNFSYRFFLISILFIIFDVEIALLLPIPLMPFHIWVLLFFSLFLLVLVLGLFYEYTWGSLDWLD